MSTRLGIGLVILLAGLLLTEAFPASTRPILPVPEKQEICDGLYNGKTVSPDVLAIELVKHRRWQAKAPNGQQANLCGADLTGAHLEGVNLEEAHLEGAFLLEAHLERAILWGAHLEGAFLWKAHLEGANLQGAHLEGANLQGTHLEKAVLSKAHLHASIFEPVSLPDIRSIASAASLSTLQFDTSPQALQELREAFKKGGYQPQEREITYALWHTQRVKDWQGTLFQKAESLFKLVLFEWPCAYGMDPWRPFQGLVLFLPLFACSYVLALRTANRRAGIWVTYSADRTYKRHNRKHEGRARMHQVLWVTSSTDKKDKRRETKREWRALVTHRPRERTQKAVLDAGRQTAGALGSLVRLPLLLSRLRALLHNQSGSIPHMTQVGSWRRTCRIALYFSLLSAFHLGWRELNVGTWITRLQGRPYTLSATGWVRTVSGFQSLLSVYLLALWVLTYFGGPFE